MFSLKAKQTTPKEAEAQADPAIERISSLWEFVHRGLYKSHPGSGASRQDLLTALCDGAGATLVDKSGEGFRLLGSLDKALGFGSRNVTPNPIDHVRLHKGSPPKMKEAAIEALEAYSREVQSVDEIERVLRERQVGFREVTKEDWAETWAEIKDRVESSGNKLMHYHAKLRVLQIDIEENAVANHLDQAEGWVVFRHILYPPTNRKMFSSSSVY